MKFTFTIIFILFLIGCDNSIDSNESTFKQEKLEELHSNAKFDELTQIEVESVSLYCWCYSDSVWKTCNTSTAVKPTDLIKPKNHLSTILGEKAKIFINDLVVDHSKKGTIPGMDVRLVMAINTKRNGQKTLAYYSDSTLCYQDKYLVKINQGVSGYLRNHFNLSSIHCD